MAKAKKVVYPRLTTEQVIRIRKMYGLSQTDFWARVLSTQSAGSRYEAGRKIPKQVEVLIRMYYLKQTFENAYEQVSGIEIGSPVFTNKEGKPIIRSGTHVLNITANRPALEKELKIKIK